MGKGTSSPRFSIFSRIIHKIGLFDRLFDNKPAYLNLKKIIIIFSYCYQDHDRTVI